MAPQQDPVITPKEARVQSKKLDATPAMGTEDLTQLAADPDANKPLVVRRIKQSWQEKCPIVELSKEFNVDLPEVIATKVGIEDDDSNLVDAKGSIQIEQQRSIAKSKDFTINAKNLAIQDLNQFKESCMQVSEASVSRNRSTIIVPAGTAPDEGWAAFRNILAEINEAANLFILPNQQNSESSERLVGLSDDVGAGFIAGHSSQPSPASDLNVDRSVDMPPTDEIGNLAVSKVIRVDQKRFFFDLGSNNRGHFLRVSEVAGSDRSSIILPLSGLKHFYEMVGHFVEITKDRIEGLTGANVRTVDPPQR
ncbi:purin-rich alpha 1 [Actinidia rufa]|uniref:Purin-rich alpha 1 n=1 Tax=Actinidia rufa TaxID=165716 RepID=A0A7J0H4U8_9ERIC|nr:purin-rich alpha 1 [Actinidia rufa]